MASRVSKSGCSYSAVIPLNCLDRLQCTWLGVAAQMELYWQQPTPAHTQGLSSRAGLSLILAAPAAQLDQRIRNVRFSIFLQVETGLTANELDFERFFRIFRTSSNSACASPWSSPESAYSYNVTNSKSCISLMEGSALKALTYFFPILTRNGTDAPLLIEGKPYKTLFPCTLR